MVSKERKKELHQHGYYVEDMQKEYGDGCEGMWRWMSDGDDFQDDEPSYSPKAAWERLDHFARTERGI